MYQWLNLGSLASIRWYQVFVVYQLKVIVCSTTLFLCFLCRSFTELDHTQGTYEIDYTYPVNSPIITTTNKTHNSITLRVYNNIDNVGTLKLFIDKFDYNPSNFVGYVATGEYIEYTFEGLSPNTSYPFYSKFVDERNNHSSNTVQTIVTTNAPLYQQPEISILSKGYGYVNFIVTNLSSSSDALLLFAELSNSSPDVYIISLYSGDSYIVSFSGLNQGTYYTFYALFKDEDNNILTPVSSISVKTLGGSC